MEMFPIQIQGHRILIFQSSIHIWFKNLPEMTELEYPMLSQSTQSRIAIPAEPTVAIMWLLKIIYDF